MRSIYKLFLAIVICEFAGIIGSFFTVAAIPGWYAQLVKPALNPPSWVFGPAWTILYALMGVSVWLVLKNNGIASLSAADHKGRRNALVAFGMQLFLNAIWSIIFFGLRSPGWAFINIVAMWFAIVWTMVLFFKISRLAGWLFAPYLFWVSFASYLNFAIWFLNR